MLHTIDLGLGSAAGHRSFNPLRTIALSQDNQRLYYQDQIAGAGNGNCRIYVEDLSADIDPAQDTQLAVNDGQCDATNNWRTDPLLWSWVPASFCWRPTGSPCITCAPRQISIRCTPSIRARACTRMRHRL